MKEAFGGAFMIRMVLVFLILYISFMAVAVNYAKVFRIKNHVIDILEQYQYDGTNDELVGDKIASYFSEAAYNFDMTDNSNINLANECEDEKHGKWFNGACVVPMQLVPNNASDAEKSSYYSVTLYLIIDFPFLGDFKFPISGETKTIVY